MNSMTRYSHHDLELNRPPLDTLIQPPVHPWSFVRGLQALASRLVRFFSAESELHIWRQNRHGHSLWWVYDPVTNQKRAFVTEEDLRIWLDRRYNN